ncbi:hypothetical protein [Falsiroseomonas sp.]|uniref:hypothetical protein n=1 Tax=Falsiroseomonas sp. TaxID=2870721 RepID=UPI002734D4B3|nr:hypothetical protein [Falsiroseomonas sp.]MDP3417845.1 hypothetical protein [Falsiroseomonas sp.]
MRGMSRRGALGASLAASVAGMPTAAARDQDAGLVAMCAEHAEALERYNRLGGRVEVEECPLALRYMAACDALDEAKPKTMIGVLALAAAAHREARSGRRDDDLTWDGPAAEWAGEIATALLRLHGI